MTSLLWGRDILWPGATGLRTLDPGPALQQPNLGGGEGMQAIFPPGIHVS